MPRALWYGFLIPGLLLLVGAAFSGYTVWETEHSTEYAPGTVERTWRGGELGLDFGAQIRFRAADGRSRTFAAAMTSRSELTAGSRVNVAYQADDPDHPRLQRGSPPSWAATVVLVIWGGGFSLIGGIPLYLRVRKARLAEWLQLNGRAVQADVSRVKHNTNLVVNGKSPYTITAHWMDPATRINYNFTSENLWTDPTAHLASKVVSVIIDPANPNRSWMDLSFLPKS